MENQDNDRTNPPGTRTAKPSEPGLDLRGGTQQATHTQGQGDISSSDPGSSRAGGIISLSGDAIENDRSTDGATGGIRSGNSGNASTTSEIKNAGRQVADEVKHQAQHFTGKAKAQGQSMLNQQKESAAEQVTSVAHAFRSTANHLQDEGQSQTGRYVDMVAQQLESFGHQLRQKDANELLRDVQDLARRSPATFIAGSVAAGFLLSRFLKSSSAHPHESKSESRDEWDSRSASRFDNQYDSGADAYQPDRDAFGQSSTSILSDQGAEFDTANSGFAENNINPLDANSNSTSPDSLAVQKPGGNRYDNR